MATGKEKNVANIDKDLAALQLEEKQLTVESLRFTVENERRRRANIAHMHQVQQDTLDAANLSILAGQKVCNHRKGGKGLAALTKGRGSDSDYAIIHHTYPWGELGIMCTRCTAEWRAPKPELKKQNPELYKEKLAEWKMVSAWPTDNEPSGTQIFLITHSGQPQAATA